MALSGFSYIQFQNQDMKNIIAVIWDFDKTLVDGYMQDPIFEEYGIDGNEFWKEVNSLPERYMKEQNVKVNPETIYLNHFINCTRKGIFPGLNNSRLKEFGRKLRFYKGVPEIFRLTKHMLDSPYYTEYDIRVEHYIVSTGFSMVIKGSSIMEYVDGVWGCELIEVQDGNGGTVIGEVGYTIDNTTKTRALFEINKGINMHPEIDVNSSIPDDRRRISFRNMIYIADGPSDVPAFSVVKSHGGSTFAIYPKGDEKAFEQVEQLRKDGRIDMFAEADYTEGNTACMWICSKIKAAAERIREEEKERIKMSAGSSPRHI